MSTKWRTPRFFFDHLHNTLKFAVDAAADEDDHLIDVWYGPGGVAEDALQVPVWDSPAWCNPPYLKGKAWEQWLAKFVEQGQLGCEIVTLIPAATGTDWWKQYVIDAGCDVFFLTGRIPFELPGRTKPTQPNHASALVIYGPKASGFVGWINWRAKLSPEPAGDAGDAEAEVSHIE